MIILQLSRGGSPLRVPLRLPCDPESAGEAFAKLDTISGELPTQIKEVICPEVSNLGQYIRRAELDSGNDYEKLNTLAAKIGRMTEKEQIIFAGALDSASINGIDDVVQVSERLDEYILIPNASSDTELGRFIAVSSQINADPRFPEASWPYLDYAKIGAEYYAEHGGAYTIHGYVLLKDSTDIRQSESEESRTEIIQLTLQTAKERYLLALPADDMDLDNAARYLDIDDFAEASIVGIGFGVPYLADLLPVDGINVEDANELALRIEEINRTDGELLKYLSVLKVEQPETFQNALRHALELDKYERVPDDMEEYARVVLDRRGVDYGLIYELEGYMDFESYGQDQMHEDGVRQTEFGLVRRLNDPFLAEQQGMKME